MAETEKSRVGPSAMTWWAVTTVPLPMYTPVPARNARARSPVLVGSGTSTRSTDRSRPALEGANKFSVVAERVAAATAACRPVERDELWVAQAEQNRRSAAAARTTWFG